MGRRRLTPRLNHAALVSCIPKDSSYLAFAPSKSPFSNDCVASSIVSSARVSAGSVALAGPEADA